MSRDTLKLLQGGKRSWLVGAARTDSFVTFWMFLV